MYDELTRLGNEVQALHIRMGNMLGKSKSYSKGLQRSDKNIWSARYDLWQAAGTTLGIDLDEPIESIAMPWSGKPTTAAGEQVNPWD